MNFTWKLCWTFCRSWVLILFFKSFNSPLPEFPWLLMLSLICRLEDQPRFHYKFPYMMHGSRIPSTESTNKINWLSFINCLMGRFRVFFGKFPMVTVHFIWYTHIFNSVKNFCQRLFNNSRFFFGSHHGVGFTRARLAISKYCTWKFGKNKLQLKILK